MEQATLELRTEPQIIHSDYLSRKTGLDVSILDYSCLPGGTHKIYKGKAIVDFAKNNGYEAILFINPVVDSSGGGKGSGVDALELACAIDYPECYVVEVVHSETPYARLEPINPDSPNSRQRVEIGVNLGKFWKPDRLEGLFRYWMSGKGKKDVHSKLSRFLGDYEADLLVDFKNSYNIKRLRNFFESKGVNPEKCIDGTNLFEFCDSGCYSYSKGLSRKLKGYFDYVGGSGGTCERALEEIRSFRDGPTHIVVLPAGHTLDPFHRYEESFASRVQTKYRIKTHNDLIKESIGRDDVLYKSVGRFEGGKAKEMFVDKAIGEDGLNIKTSPDGTLAFSILREIDNPAHAKHFTRTGLRLFNTYKASETGFTYLYNLEIPFGSKVCIINTGKSDITLLRQLIEKRLVN